MMMPATRRREAALERDCLAHALDLFAAGVVLLNDDGSVMHMNAAAADITTRDDGLAIRHNRLVAGRAFESARLREALAGDGDELVTVSRSGGRRAYQLWVTQYRGDASSVGVAVVVICDPAAKSARPEKLLQRLYCFTATEARVAAYLMNGCSIHQTAAELGMRMGTAKTHLKSIFLKTHTQRQAQLACLLLRGIASLRLIT